MTTSASPAAAALLACRVFTLQDQQAFAEASGDRNPLHLDAAAASLTQAGEPVVHGVHALIWALDAIAAGPLRDRPIRSVRAQFLRFAYLGRPIELKMKRFDGQRAEAALWDGVVTLTTLSIEVGEPAPQAANPYEGAPATQFGAKPLEPSEAEMAVGRGWLEPAAGAAGLSAGFPHLAHRIGGDRLAALAALSGLVGMACPGLHSIFSAVAFEVLANPSSRAGFGWAARRPDPRYGRIEIGAHGSGLRMEARTLIRPPPVAAPSMAEAAARVGREAFAGRRALVIGGSRGLGAATAKLLAAGGARVMITYAAHVAQAEAVAADIAVARSPDAVSALRLDVLEPYDDAMRHGLAEATHIYYFATPRIARQGAAVFDPELFGEFARIYVAAFHDLCACAAALSQAERLHVLYPSTVFIDERPRGMTEYAMAKSAGELLCADLMRSHPRLKITAPRIPRVLTDQTALAIPVKTMSALDAVLPLLAAEG